MKQCEWTFSSENPSSVYPVAFMENIPAGVEEIPTDCPTEDANLDSTSCRGKH